MGEHVLQTSYEPFLVALSILIAMAAAFMALELATRVSAARGRARALWLAGGSAAMGFGVWGMHLTGMMAYRMPLPVAYEPVLMVASLLVAMAASGVALWLAAGARLGSGALLLGGLAMGLGIAGMHHLGLRALIIEAVPSYRPAVVAASVLIAVVASTAALWLAFRLRTEAPAAWSLRRLAAAATMGLAIAGMNYTGMAGIRFHPTDVTMAPMTTALHVTDVDALIVGLCALLILGMGLLGSVREMVAARQRALEEARLSLAAIVESSADAILSIDRVGRITSWNAAAERMFGYRAGEMLGTDGQAIVPPEAADERAAQLAAVLMGQALDGHETERVRRDGQRIAVALTMSPLRAADGAIMGAAVIARDITARKRAEVELAQRTAELLRVNEELQRADRHKDEFLSVISHELRTPLNFITGFASILEDEVPGPLNEVQRRYMGKILDGADVMLHLVNDLLDAAKMQAGKLHLDPGPTDLPALVEQVVARLQPLAARKQIRLAATVDVPFEPEVDGMRIGQVITNLVGNAIKFTPHGGEVAVRVWADPAAPGAVVFQVRDTGVGIAEADIQRLFTPFQQADMSVTRQAGGTGLGLSISKAIVEAHGGEIGVMSEPGAGSTFWFRLPCIPSPLRGADRRGKALQGLPEPGETRGTA